MTTYFGFAVADGMFPLACTTDRLPVPVEWVRERLTTGKVVVVANPSHVATVHAARDRYNLPLVMPLTAPNVVLQPGDKFIVMRHNLPRLDKPREYTAEEIAGATFTFGEWTVR